MLNICTLKIARALGLSEENFEPFHQLIRVYDNSSRKIVGKMNLEVRVGPCPMSTPFMAIDVPASFNLLLGRPWLCDVGGIGSTLHQKIKSV